MNKEIIIISSVDLDIHRQWHHEIVEYLNKKRKNSFIENTGTRRIKINEFSRV